MAQRFRGYVNRLFNKDLSAMQPITTGPIKAEGWLGDTVFPGVSIYEGDAERAAKMKTIASGALIFKPIQAGALTTELVTKKFRVRDGIPTYDANFAVEDTARPTEYSDSAMPYDQICRCYSLEDAELIAKALNALPEAAERRPTASRPDDIGGSPDGLALTQSG